MRNKTAELFAVVYSASWMRKANANSGSEPHGKLNAISEARRGGPIRSRKVFVEKWCYFPELHKMTKILEEWIENWFKK